MRVERERRGCVEIPDHVIGGQSHIGAIGAFSRQPQLPIGEFEQLLRLTQSGNQTVIAALLRLCLQIDQQLIDGLTLFKQTQLTCDRLAVVTDAFTSCQCTSTDSHQQARPQVVNQAHPACPAPVGSVSCIHGRETLIKYPRLSVSYRRPGKARFAGNGGSIAKKRNAVQGAGTTRP